MEAIGLHNALASKLNSVNTETREKLAEAFKDPIFIPQYDVSIRKQKEIAQEKLKKISSLNLVSIRDFFTNPENIFTTHEMVN